jgi:subtilase family serine protease
MLSRLMRWVALGQRMDLGRRVAPGRRVALGRRVVPLAVAAGLAVAYLPAAGAAGATGSAGAARGTEVLGSAGVSGTTGAGGGGPLRARVTGAAIPGTAVRPVVAAPPSAGPPSRKEQIKVLTAMLTKMRAHYKSFAQDTPGPQDIFDYNIGQLWRRGIDGAGTTVAVIEGWDFPQIGQQVAAYDKVFGLPNPQITTIFPAGKLPAKCPPGMVKLGSYGSCSAWQGELTLDVLSVHLIAPYAKIVISATPADTQETDDPASQVAPPEMMKALESIASGHLANVISISDGTGESSYSRGTPELTAQNPGELAAAAAGIPVLVATGDCGPVQNLPVANSQCGSASAGPDTAAWDDSPWITAVGGSVPNFTITAQRAGSDPVWDVGGEFAEGAGYSTVYSRPSYQNGVAHTTGSRQRSVPDITMDAQDGTSEAAPLLGGVLALATQVNHGNVGPINPVLYRTLGPSGARDGIADVVHGSNAVSISDQKASLGFTAAKGFDVASGWGTVNAAKFVPSLAAATRSAREDAVVRRQAGSQLAALGRRITLSARSISRNGTSYLLATGYLPGHPVRLSIDGRAIGTLRATSLGTVTYLISPAQLKLAAGRHVLRLSSLLLTSEKALTSH